MNHFSIAKRLSAFGLVGLVLFLPLLILIPFKLITAYRANRRMNEFFGSQAFHLRPIPPGGTSEGFVFTPFDAGIKVIHVSLHSTGDLLDSATGLIKSHGTADADTEFTFSIPVPGIAADYLRRDFEAMDTACSTIECDLPTLTKHLCEMPPATGNAKATRTGRYGLISSSSLNLKLCWVLSQLVGRAKLSRLPRVGKPHRTFLLGAIPIFTGECSVFIRPQPGYNCQRSRRSINGGYLRLWLTPLRFQGISVWVGQVSRDIGVRFTTKTWNLTTHRVDPDVDEASAIM